MGKAKEQKQRMFTKQLSPQGRRAVLPFILVIGILLVILGVRQNSVLNASTMVEAEIVSYVAENSENIMEKDGETTVYYPVYQYESDGKTVEVTSSTALVDMPIVGEKATIYVNDAVTNVSGFSGKTYVVAGTVFIIFSLVMIAMEVVSMKYKAKPSEKIKKNNGK